MIAAAKGPGHRAPHWRGVAEGVIRGLRSIDRRPLDAATFEGFVRLEETERRLRAARDRLSADERRAALGCWILRSTDGGRTWNAPVDSLVNSPHGPIQLADGRLLYAGKTLWRSPERVGACESTDDGQSWRWLGEIPARPGDDPQDYHELHAVETTDGRIVAASREGFPIGLR